MLIEGQRSSGTRRRLCGCAALRGYGMTLVWMRLAGMCCGCSWSLTPHGGSEGRMVPGSTTCARTGISWARSASHGLRGSGRPSRPSRAYTAERAILGPQTCPAHRPRCGRREGRRLCFSAARGGGGRGGGGRRGRWNGGCQVITVHGVAFVVSRAASALRELPHLS